MFSDKEDDIFTNTVSNENKTLADRQSVTYGIVKYWDFPTLVNANISSYSGPDKSTVTLGIAIYRDFPTHVSRKVNSYIWHWSR